LSKDPAILLGHILESIDLIVSYTSHRSREDFMSDPQMQDSIIRRITVIGEAVKHLPDDVKDATPDIPWKQISGMRDILIHSYFSVDLDLTWGVVRRDLPYLRSKVAAMV